MLIDHIQLTFFMLFALLCNILYLLTFCLWPFKITMNSLFYIAEKFYCDQHFQSNIVYYIPLGDIMDLEPNFILYHDRICRPNPNRCDIINSSGSKKAEKFEIDLH